MNGRIGEVLAKTADVSVEEEVHAFLIDRRARNLSPGPSTSTSRSSHCFRDS